MTDVRPYDLVRDAVVDLDLSLVRLEQQRRTLEDLFRDVSEAPGEPTAAASAGRGAAR
jgi:hypothetical protein